MNTSPRHIHSQSNDRSMDGGEGQLLKMIPFFVLGGHFAAFPLKVHLQVGDAADSWAGLQKDTRTDLYIMQ